MGYIARVDVAVQTDTASAADVYSGSVLNGLLYAVEFDPSSGSPWSSAGDFIITKEGGGDVIHLDLASGVSQMFFPRRNANTTASGAFDPMGNASGKVPVMIPFADERVRVQVTSGGATTSGVVRFYLS
jgi:hypothetical protein